MDYYKARWIYNMNTNAWAIGLLVVVIGLAIAALLGMFVGVGGYSSSMAYVQNHPDEYLSIFNGEIVATDQTIGSIRAGSLLAALTGGIIGVLATVSGIIIGKSYNDYHEKLAQRVSEKKSK